MAGCPLRCLPCGQRVHADCIDLSSTSGCGRAFLGGLDHFQRISPNDLKVYSKTGPGSSL